MTESETLSARVESLEARIAYQDRAIEDLNKSVVEQWQQIEKLTKHAERMADRLQRVEDNSPSSGADEPPPPHY